MRLFDPGAEGGVSGGDVSLGGSTSAPISDSPSMESEPSAPDPVETTSDSTQAPAPELPKFPSHEDFGWDDWDGESDGLPEEIRGWATGFAGYHDKRLSNERNEIELIRKDLQDLLEGVEDPRIGDLTQAKQRLEQELNALKATSQEREAAYEAFQKQVDQFVIDQATTQAKAFRDANAWIFEKPELEKLGEQLLDDGWDVDHLPKLLKLPKGILEKVRDTFKTHKNPELSIRTVLAESATRPTGVEHFVAGADGPVTLGRQSDANIPDNLTHHERIRLVAARNMKRLKGGSK